MYLTILFSFLTVVAGVLGFLGIGFGDIPVMRIVFIILFALTLVFYVAERRRKRKKYYD